MALQLPIDYTPEVLKKMSTDVLTRKLRKVVYVDINSSYIPVLVKELQSRGSQK